MYLPVRKGFARIIKVLDLINPWLVLLSLLGLFLDYTPLKQFARLPNEILALLFVLDFLLRLLAYPPKKYFFKAYGWVDFLASLPGFLLIFQTGSVFAVFKVVRVGRFFKMIRLLRFLRVFTFLKHMRNDSPWIQERIMQIGLSLILVFVIGISCIDYLDRSNLENLKSLPLEQAWKEADGNTQYLAQMTENVKFYSYKGQIYDQYNKHADNALQAEYKSLSTSDTGHWMELGFTDQSIKTASGLEYPSEGLLLETADLETMHDNLMLIVLSTLICILLFIIFYMGSRFAKDMRVVQLIVDSIDAEDYVLLKDETNKLRNSEGDFVLEPAENELDSLMKMLGKLLDSKEDPGLGIESVFADLGAPVKLGNEDSFGVWEELREMRKLLEEQVEVKDEYIKKSVQASLKILLPRIAAYLKKRS